MHCVYSDWSPPFWLPLGILALKCSHNGWSYGANLWWLFVLWPTNWKWILLWHVPWGRVGYIFFFIVIAKFMLPACSRNKVICSTADCFVLCSMFHPQANALQLDLKLQVKARMSRFFLCVYFRGVSSNDFSALETLCKKIMKEKQAFERLEVKKETLLEMFKVGWFRRLFLASCSYSLSICDFSRIFC